ncbi:hypothetical protein SESBI_07342 [Sesbania bispinosa]|nr:hypothetical protein SESBI_07342 [Sesbania bispinosa]
MIYTTLISPQGSYHDDKDEKEEIITTSTVYGITEDELYRPLQKFENKNYNLNIHAQEAVMARDTAQSSNPIPTLNNLDNRCLYPPGRIIHIVPVSSSDNSDSNVEAYLYETPRELYGKIRLSKSMIKDHSKTSYKKMIEQAIHQPEKKKPLHDNVR